MRLLMLLPALITFLGGTAVVIYYTGRCVEIIDNKIDTYSELKAFGLCFGWVWLGLCAALTALHSLAG